MLQASGLARSRRGLALTRTTQSMTTQSRQRDLELVCGYVMTRLMLTNEFGAAIAVVVAGSAAANWFGAVQVMKARKKYGVKYPTLYATGEGEDTHMFNSAQRAHQNTLENIGQLNITLLISALVYPKAAATFGLVWCFRRVLYIKGYADKGPDGRMLGAIVAHLGDLPLLVLTMVAGYKMVTSA